jgi:uncharacterized protein YciI
MSVFHVAVTAAADYLARREPHRRAHIERLQDLRARGVLVGGGPAPDGRSADITYRAEDRGRLARLIEEDPYWQNGVWREYVPKTLSRFVDRLALPPVVLDGSRRLTVVEGPASDAAAAEAALVSLRDAGRVEFGGIGEDGRVYALARTASEDEARRWLAESGAWEASRLTTRPLLYVL